MKIFNPLALWVLFACPALAVAQEPAAFFRDHSPDEAFSGPWSPAASPPSSPDVMGIPRGVADEAPEAALQVRGAGLMLLQEEVAPHLHFGLAFYARVDVPGDTSIDSLDNVAYSDIFDVGFGVNAEASLMSWISPHWALGGYVSIGWDRFSGASDVDMGTGEFFSFDDQDTVTAIFGGKVLQKFAPFWFWEGRMGIGLVHYGGLTFTDVTTPVAVSGLQFFKPVNHGLFDLGGRVGFGNSRVTLDLGLDFRFMGGEARGRDVSSLIDPNMFFVFALDLGISLRF